MIAVMADSVELNVDGKEMKRRAKFMYNKFLDIDEKVLYIGGLSLSARSDAIRINLLSIREPNSQYGSMTGCISNLYINGLRMGFAEAVTSRFLRPECIWTYACADKPCSLGKVCKEISYYDYMCVCENDRPCDSENNKPTFLPKQLIQTQTVNVREGERTVLTPNHISLSFDPKMLGLNLENIIYRIITAARYGRINVDIQPGILSLKNDYAFTAEELKDSKVTYIHNGSENRADSIDFSAEFKTHSPMNLPLRLKKPYYFTLNVHITPGNDPPKIIITSSIKMIRFTKIILTKDLMRAADNDNPPSSLIWRVKNKTPYSGFFELNERSTDTFTQADINAGRVTYSHRGEKKVYISVQVSDGQQSTTSTLKIEALPLKLTSENNTGLYCYSGDILAITSQNLSFTTNVVGQHFDIEYVIFDAPLYGHVEKREDDTWRATSHFKQSDIDNGLIRYKHDIKYPAPKKDSFKYYTKLLKVESTEYNFFIHIESIVLKLKTKSLDLRAVGSIVLTNKHIKAVSSVLQHKPSDLKFSLIKPPKRGFLTLDNAKLDQNSSWTQQDLNDGAVEYRLNNALFKEQKDEFEIKAFVDRNSSSVHKLKIAYRPIEKGVKYVNTGLRNVNEGGRGNITIKELSLMTIDTKKFVYSLVEPPMHGRLYLVGSEDYYSKSFTTDDLIKKKLYYEHDDSENEIDEFKFRATPLQSEKEPRRTKISNFTDTFIIRMKMKNDEKPLRTKSKILHVVQNSSRILTPEILTYEDADLHTDNTQLQYSINKNDSAIGYLIRSFDKTKVYAFTQDDVNKGRIAFVHTGSFSTGRLVYTVTDGQSYTKGAIDIEASKALIKIDNNTGLAVFKGQKIIITNYNLSVTGNFDLNYSAVYFRIERRPDHGRILKLNEHTGKFTFADIQNRLVSYKHYGKNLKEDSFDFAIYSGKLMAKGTCEIRVFLNVEQMPPRIIALKSLRVYEQGSKIITRDILEIQHSQTLPNEIRYRVEVHPRHGRLLLKRGRRGARHNPKTFTQQDINDELVLYEHRRKGSNKDSLRFRVSNGIRAINTELIINIEQMLIPFEPSRVLQVQEGSYTELTSDLFKTDSLIDLDFVVVRQPIHGKIYYLGKRDIKIYQFNWNDIQRNDISYLHDHSDTIKDNFTLLVKRSRKNVQTSDPTIFHVEIKSLNDKRPQLNVKTIKFWHFRKTVIGKRHIHVRDKDTKPKFLTIFILDGSDDCWFAYKFQPNVRLSNFTQHQINKGQIIYVHESTSSSASFTLIAADGKHRTQRKTLKVKVKKLELTLQVNEVILAFPLVKTILSSKDHLKTITNDIDNARNITYNIQSKFKHGRLVNLQDQEVTSFQQYDIDMGNIAYKHTDAVRTMDRDEAKMDISTPFAQDLAHTPISVRISYNFLTNQNQAELIKIKPIIISEGESFVLKDHFDDTMLVKKISDPTSIMYGIKSKPFHGVLTKNNRNISTKSSFSRDDLLSGRVKYIHDDSDTTKDNFTLVLTADYKKISYNTKGLGIVIHIDIKPINDEPWILLNTNPEIHVILGFTSVVNQSTFNIKDPDTESDQIIYTVTERPDNGYLAFENSLDKEELTWTQRDINSQRLIFVQNGRPKTAALQVRVSDGGVHRHADHIACIITVHPLTLSINPRNLNNVKILQGRSAIVITKDNILPKTNGIANIVQYNVTKPPKYGKLYLRNTPVSSFSQWDVNRNLLMYVQTNLSSGNDSFIFDAYDEYNEIAGNVLKISIISQITVKDFQAVSNQQMPITLAHLNAANLASLTNDDPLFRIISRPRIGSLRMRGSPESVSKFKQQDLVEEKIFFESYTVYDLEKDSFIYEVSARYAQPVRGIFNITILPTAPTTAKAHLSTLSTERDQKTDSKIRPTPREKTDSEEESDSVSQGHLLIVIIVCAVALVTILTFVIIKCVKMRKKQKQNQVPTRKESASMLKKEECSQKTESDWQKVDAELLQHCRTTNPVLHTNKYWV
ncbi:unnamed protein product [Dimorphilus gyrociliatus]|uniref:PLD phosphodiesterase domain-containing protein n=1 Tax=Dimorphilus gyrociliatus TaxID=2664684 RepID=A0A7I8VSP4_9ANNE|nr:unnamed protein product [Dimorphilus gyrociliatus]